MRYQVYEPNQMNIIGVTHSHYPYNLNTFKNTKVVA
jgi:hypothetical protein